MAESLIETKQTSIRGYLSLKFFSSLNITPEIKKSLAEYINYYSKQRNYQILNIHILETEARMIIDYPPSVSVAELVKLLKSHSSRNMREKFPSLATQKRLWVDERQESRKGYVFVSLSPIEPLPDIHE